MNKKLIILLAGLLSSVLLFISILPVAAEHTRYPNLNLAPIQVEPPDGLGGEREQVERCSARPISNYSFPTPPLLNGSSIFNDAELNKLTISPFSPVAADPACTITALYTES